MSLFGYFSLGLQSLNAAQMGLQVAGDNISNAFTPGYGRRRVELSPGFPVRVPGGYLDQGVVVERLNRMEDMFTQAALYRELGQQAGGEERLRGLKQVESLFGSLDQSGTIAASLAQFSAAMSEAAAQPESMPLRRAAVAAADGLARSIRSTYERLDAQRSLEDRSAQEIVEQANSLAGELAALNREIATAEAGGGVAAPLRDRRIVIVEELTRLTGGSAITAGDGRVHFSMSGGPTLVTGDAVLPLSTLRASDGTARILAGANGRDVTDRLREGRLGAVLHVRDETIAQKMKDLNTLATEIVRGSNPETLAGFGLDGQRGLVLFLPAPAFGPLVAARMEVNPDLVDDPVRLGLSAGGAPGDGTIAERLAALATTSRAGLGDVDPQAFLADMQSTLGNEIVRTDVDHSVSRSLVETLVAQRDAASAVSLDEEAVALIENQRAYEAAARFIQVLNSITEVAVNLANR